MPEKHCYSFWNKNKGSQGWRSAIPEESSVRDSLAALGIKSQQYTGMRTQRTEMIGLFKKNLAIIKILASKICTVNVCFQCSSNIFKKYFCDLKLCIKYSI